MSETTNFKPDYRIAKLSLFGLFGLIIGCLILFYPDLYSFKSADSVFHEVKYSPKELIGPSLIAKVDSLNKENLVRNINKKEKALLLKRTKDTVQKVALGKQIESLDATIAIDAVNIKILKGYIGYETNSVADSVSFDKLNKALHFKIDTGCLKKWETDYQCATDTFYADYVFKDPEMSFPIEGRVALIAKPSSSDVAFFARYPTTGIWVLLILIFSSFLCIAIATSFYINSKTIKLFKDNKIGGVTRRDYIIYAVITFCALFLIWFLGKISFNDEEVIMGLFFMRTFKISMLYLQVLGFIGGALCLAGFIYTAAMLGYFSKQLKKREKTIYQQKTGGAPSEQNAPGATEPKPLSSNEADQDRDKGIYDQLNGFFQRYFMLAAVILSLLVLCTGGLYGIVNDMPFVKLLINDWGYSPARTDFIYLYGGFYTVILLLVYVPAKMRFAEISFAGANEPKKEEGDKKLNGLFKNLSGQMKELLIAGSPFLVSLIQALFESFS